MIELLSPRQKKFGFYQVGDFQSFSKFEAIENHNKHGHRVDWKFNDEVYGSMNWMQEPTESLNELYRQRAQQLRDKYDHLVLWYSGGADSDCILNTFINNNIKIDEVASYVNYEATSDKLNTLNAEIFHVAAPKINRLQEKQPWLKHTVIDLSTLIIESFNGPDALFDWTYNLNIHVNPNTFSRRDIKLKIPEWVKMFDTGKKVGFIYGIDKPRVVGYKGQFWFKFVDMIDSAVSAGVQMLDRSWEFDELFYWSPDSPKIPIKQAHVIKNLLKTCDSTSNVLATTSQAGCCCVTLDGTVYWLKTDAMHRLIYPGWQKVPYQSKAGGLGKSPRDIWFFNMSDSEKAKYIWRTGYLHRWSSTPHYYRKNPDNWADGFKVFSSTPYYVGA